MHGTFQGGMTAVQGGKFWSGFASGALSSLVSSAWQGGESFRKIGDLKIKFTDAVHKGVGGALGISNRAISTMLLGTITGGAGAALTGGNFWQGAVTGLIVSALNHTLHDAVNGDTDPPVQKKYTFEKGKSYDIAIKYKSAVETPIVGHSELTISYNGETIESSGWSFFSGFGIGPNDVGLFMQYSTDKIHFTANLSGDSVLDVFKQTGLVSYKTIGSAVLYTQIIGYDSPSTMNQLWTAHLIGTGLSAGISGQREVPSFTNVK